MIARDCAPRLRADYAGHSRSDQVWVTSSPSKETSATKHTDYWAPQLSPDSWGLIIYITQSHSHSRTLQYRTTPDRLESRLQRQVTRQGTSLTRSRLQPGTAAHSDSVSTRARRLCKTEIFNVYYFAPQPKLYSGCTHTTLQSPPHDPSTSTRRATSARHTSDRADRRRDILLLAVPVRAPPALLSELELPTEHIELHLPEGGLLEVVGGLARPCELLD